MNYYKICECQNVLKFDKPYMCPDPCPYCGRMTQNYITYRGEPPMPQSTQVIADETQRSPEIPTGPMTQPVFSQMPYNQNSGAANNSNGSISQPAANVVRGMAKSYYFVSADGRYQIPIPEEGGVVGRTGLGAEQLAYNNAVSKQHLNVMINKRLGVFVEDISSFGTKVNGEELIKGSKVLIKPGDHVTLYNEELILAGR